MLISIFNGIAVKDRWIIDFQMAISVRFSRRPRCTGATALGRCPQLAAETWGVHAEQSEGCTAAASKQRSRARPIRADSARAQVHLKAPEAERSGDATLLAAGGARNAGVSARACPTPNDASACSRPARQHRLPRRLHGGCTMAALCRPSPIVSWLPLYRTSPFSRLSTLCSL